MNDSSNRNQTPSEKAYELVSSFSNHSRGESRQSNLWSAQGCAHMHVIHMIRELKYIAPEYIHDAAWKKEIVAARHEFWAQVDKEIDLIK